MMRADAVLVALVVASALGVVAAQHQARRLYSEYEREQARAQALEVEWGSCNSSKVPGPPTAGSKNWRAKSSACACRPRGR